MNLEDDPFHTYSEKLGWRFKLNLIDRRLGDGDTEKGNNTISAFEEALINSSNIEDDDDAAAKWIKAHS